MNRNILIFGASSGLGLYLLQNLPNSGDTVYTVSRRAPDISNLAFKHIHIKADLNDVHSSEYIREAIKCDTIDLFIYCSGTWEMVPLSEISASDIQEIINVNLSSFIANIFSLVDKLRLAKGKVIAIGSTSGLDNAVGGGPVYAASKFGMRGAIHGFRSLLSDMDISSSIINIGGFNKVDSHDENRIDLSEALRVVDMISSSGPSACIKEIDLANFKCGSNGV